MGRVEKQEPTGVEASLGSYERGVQAALERLGRERAAERLWGRDAGLWKEDASVQAKIGQRLGWLDLVSPMRQQIPDLSGFVRSLTDAGFAHAVVLGMGGSSLCPEVCRQTYGFAKGFLDLKVLDSTDPATILKVERGLDLRKTVFIVSSKSGTTIEMQSLYRYFLGRVRSVGSQAAGDHFVAITDPGTPLESLAHKEKFRRVFRTPADVGGRFSALTYFGLVPMALIGVDLAAFLDRAAEMTRRCGPDVAPPGNSGVRLGAILGALGRVGCDKVTLVASKPIASFGLWAEQLLAESTGKEGTGLVPVAGESLGEPSRYGKDRVFIYLRLADAADKRQDHAVDQLERSGMPVVRIHLRDRLDLSGEFFRWEVATAVAGAILGINPFDEPNVAESKDNTRRVLEDYQKTGRLAGPENTLEEGDIALFDPSRPSAKGSLKEVFWSFLSRARASDYVALMVYVEASDANERLLQRLRIAIRDRFKVATTLGYGPRFLHSTGQLHKGGATNGIFIQVTAEDAEDIPIPGEKYTFGILKRAQALGDHASLVNRKLPLLRVHLGGDPGRGLGALIQEPGIA